MLGVPSCGQQGAQRGAAASPERKARPRRPASFSSSGDPFWSQPGSLWLPGSLRKCLLCIGSWGWGHTRVPAVSRLGVQCRGPSSDGGAHRQLNNPRQMEGSSLEGKAWRDLFGPDQQFPSALTWTFSVLLGDECLGHQSHPSSPPHSRDLMGAPPHLSFPPWLPFAYRRKPNSSPGHLNLLSLATTDHKPSPVPGSPSVPIYTWKTPMHPSKPNSILEHLECNSPG